MFLEFLNFLICLCVNNATNCLVIACREMNLLKIEYELFKKFRMFFFSEFSNFLISESVNNVVYYLLITSNAIKLVKLELSF